MIASGMPRFSSCNIPERARHRREDEQSAKELVVALVKLVGPNTGKPLQIVDANGDPVRARVSVQDKDNDVPLRSGNPAAAATDPLGILSLRN